MGVKLINRFFILSDVNKFQKNKATEGEDEVVQPADPVEMECVEATDDVAVAVPE